MSKHPYGHYVQNFITKWRQVPNSVDYNKKNKKGPYFLLSLLGQISHFLDKCCPSNGFNLRKAYWAFECAKAKMLKYLSCTVLRRRNMKTQSLQVSNAEKQIKDFYFYFSPNLYTGHLLLLTKAQWSHHQGATNEQRKRKKIVI